MKKVWVITKFELYKIVTDTWYPILYFLLPLIFLIIPIVALWIDTWSAVELTKIWVKDQVGFKDLLTVGVVDHSKLISLYGEYRYKKPLKREEDQIIQFVKFSGEEEGYKALKNQEVDTYLLIPEDFIKTGKVQSYLPFEKGKLPHLLPPDAFNDWLTDNLLLSTQMNPHILKRIREPFFSTRDYIDILSGETIGLQTLNASFKKSMLILFITLFITFIVLLPSDYLFDSFRNEKKTRLLEILLTSVTPLELLLGKFLSVLIATFLPFIFWFSIIRSFLLGNSQYFTSLGAFDLHFTESQIGLIIFYALLGMTFYGALFLAIGLIGNPTISRRLVKFCRPAMIVPQLLVLKSLFLKAEIPLLFKILSYIPIFTPTAMVLKVGIHDMPGLIEIVSTGLITLIAIGAFVKISCVLLRKSAVVERLFHLNWEVSTSPTFN